MVLFIELIYLLPRRRFWSETLRSLKRGQSETGMCPNDAPVVERLLRALDTLSASLPWHACLPNVGSNRQINGETSSLPYADSRLCVCFPLSTAVSNQPDRKTARGLAYILLQFIF